jgi:hypothetical protein
MMEPTTDKPVAGAGVDDGPVFGALSPPYPAAVVGMRDHRKAPPITDPRITEGLTEAAHAYRLADVMREVLRHDHQRRVSLLWARYRCLEDETGERYRWLEDKTGERYRLAMEAARDLYLTATTIENLKVREAIASFVIHCESRRALENVLELLKNLPPIAERGDRWNRNPQELNTPRGW